jgi:hypothetical protein
MPLARWWPVTIGSGRRRLVDHVAGAAGRHRVELGRVLTDHGPEFTGRAFTSHLGGRNIGHHRIPPRSPNHNAVCERFQGTACRSSPGPPSTASTSLAWPTSTPSSRAGSSTPTPAAPTTATSCAAARPLRSWRRTDHDQAEGSPVTSTRAQEGLVQISRSDRTSWVSTLACGGAGLSPAHHHPVGSEGSQLTRLLWTAWSGFLVVRPAVTPPVRNALDDDPVNTGSLNRQGWHLSDGYASTRNRKAGYLPALLSVLAAIE